MAGLRLGDSLLIAGAWLVAAELGPYVCDNGCQIGHPVPDKPTLAYIEQMKPRFNRWFGDIFWNKATFTSSAIRPAARSTTTNRQ